MDANLKIEGVKEVVPTPDGAVVIKADAVLGDQRSEVEIAITTDLAAKVAVALLATTAQARAARDGLEPALEVLAAAVVASGCADIVRMHMIFDQGVVLPLEMNADAATAFRKSLNEERPE